MNQKKDYIGTGFAIGILAGTFLALIGFFLSEVCGILFYNIEGPICIAAQYLFGIPFFIIFALLVAITGGFEPIGMFIATSIILVIITSVTGSLFGYIFGKIKS